MERISVGANNKELNKAARTNLCRIRNGGLQCKLKRATTKYCTNTPQQRVEFLTQHSERAHTDDRQSDSQCETVPYARDSALVRR